ncbi:acyl-CoA dehydrogenase family protein [Actinomadura algeriensis]|uniref:Alkylation response protein AidB-like acyl-CoA dehydrogenase n=1 Tax=Actinomadura algeriensis TaxID=1679523 RepID=A0ABR9JYB5_9ACTN|nr:acyl-CoA dehydrogenase family protein [Actinomadura algeriensis]MBE1535569.1 alkylation response protein AidB-like acyl-CoA dehydrogenase [Actinomadura algeriensis]
MTADLSEFHGELRAAASGLLAGTPGWRAIADAGWPGLEAPAAFDGADGTFAEVAVVLQEIGRAAAPGPYPSVAALAIGTLGLLSPGPGRDELLRATVAGGTVPVVALDAEGTEAFRLTGGARPDGARLHGAAAFVLDASAADRVLVPAADPDGTAVVADVDPADLTVEDRPVVDATRSLGRVAADGVAVRPESLHRFRVPDALERIRDRAAVAIACDCLGIAEAMLDATVAYTSDRRQFGRPVGSFQAVKHACADMLVRVTVTRELVAAAVRAQADGGPDAAAACSMAKSYACAAAVEVAGKAMQLHGGMGYTWESGVHVYLKRAALNRSLFGTPARHRARLAVRYARR